jgi:hypothetical protein
MWNVKKCVARKKQAKLQWLQRPSKVSENNLSNIRREARRHFGSKKREYLKERNINLESAIIRISGICTGA